MKNYIYSKMYLTFSFFILFIFCDFVVFASEDIHCIENSDNNMCRFGIIEPYRNVANFNDSEIIIPGCKAKKIWLFVRHGTRLPNKSNIKLMSRVPILQDDVIEHCENNENCGLSVENLEALGNWKFPKIPKSEFMTLLKEGKNELLEIGKRYQSRFPDLMPKNYDNVTYRFESTYTQRTLESGRQFAIGLFGEQQISNVEFINSQYLINPVLQFYSVCDKWKKEVLRNSDASNEYKKFLKSEIFKTMLENISKRFGTEMNFVDVVAIYAMCTYETAWDEDKTSPWCSVLSSEDFQVLEYVTDLMEYYTSGYAYPLTAQQACPPILNMFEFFRSEEPQKVSAYFGHSDAITKILTALGVAHDSEPLLYDSFESSKDRLWRTSLLNAFASNIAFILYDCESNEPGILFMHQERIITLPGCPENLPCPLSFMEKMYPDNDDECDFDNICANTP